ncbi:MAG: hypothetical protein V4602_02500 [Pseudomonadota bacterium]
MCNLDKIYALIVLESAALGTRPLKSMQNELQDKMIDGRDAYRPTFGSRIAFFMSRRSQYASPMPEVQR